MRPSSILILLVTVVLVCCGGDGGASTDVGVPDVTPGPIVFGCPTYPDPIAFEGADNGTFDDIAPFFEMYCVRCHSTELTTRDERNFAPAGLNWNDETSVRRNRDLIRDAIGVSNFMPPSDPTPSCEERRRVVAWIDSGAP